MDEFFSAITAGDRAAVERRLAEEPSLASARREDGTSAVLVAAYVQRPEIARLLASKRADLTIFEAASVGDVERVRAIVDADPGAANAFAHDGFQPLGLAAFFGHAVVATLLLARGADPSAASRNEMRVTPLHSAVAAGHGPIARALIQAGAAVNVKQRHGWTPLHGAAERGDRELVLLLLDRDADPLATNDVGMTAAAYARSKGNEELARLIEARVQH
jgi:ankyrin repeat protein